MGKKERTDWINESWGSQKEMVAATRKLIATLQQQFGMQHGKNNRAPHLIGINGGSISSVVHYGGKRIVRKIALYSFNNNGIAFSTATGHSITFTIDNSCEMEIQSIEGTIYAEKNGVANCFTIEVEQNRQREYISIDNYNSDFLR